MLFEGHADDSKTSGKSKEIKRNFSKKMVILIWKKFNGSSRRLGTTNMYYWIVYWTNNNFQITTQNKTIKAKFNCKRQNQKIQHLSSRYSRSL